MSGKYVAYPEYKYSGVEWLGEIPVSWDVLPIKRLSEIFNGATPKSGEKLFWDGDISWVTPADLGKSSTPYISEGSRSITAEGYSSCGTSIVPKNSVILSSRAPIGTLGISLNDLCTNQGCKSLVVKNNYSPKFLYYVLLSSTKQLNLLGRGTTFLEISSDELGSYKVASPSEVDANTIANFLDHETAKIDTLIEKQQQLIALLKEKRQAVISHAVTKGLNANVPMRDSGVEWLGEVPEHWEAVSIKRIFSQEKKQGFPDLEVLSVYRDFGVIKKSSRSDNNNKTPENLTLYQLVEVGDLVINKMKAWQGSLGISEHVGITSPDYIVYKTNDQDRSEFFHFLLRSQMMPDVYRSISNGVRPSQWRLEPGSFEELKLFLPPVEESDSIVEYVESSLKSYEELIENCEGAISLMHERRTALISAAVTGKIDVRNWQAPETNHASRKGISV